MAANKYLQTIINFYTYIGTHGNLLPNCIYILKDNSLIGRSLTENQTLIMQMRIK